MKIKHLGLVLLAAGCLSAATITTADAATKVPSKFRHSWYMPLKQDKDPQFIKFKASSMDSGNKSFHHKISGKDLQVLKKKRGWYQIGYKGNANSLYKIQKLKVSGKKRTVMLQKNSNKSHDATVYLNGKKVKYTLNASNYFLG